MSPYVRRWCDKVPAAFGVLPWSLLVTSLALLSTSALVIVQLVNVVHHVSPMSHDTAINGTPAFVVSPAGRSDVGTRIVGEPSGTP